MCEYCALFYNCAFCFSRTTPSIRCHHTSHIHKSTQQLEHISWSKKRLYYAQCITAFISWPKLLINVIFNSAFTSFQSSNSLFTVYIDIADIRIKSHLVHNVKTCLHVCLYFVLPNQHQTTFAVFVPPAFRHLRYDWLQTSRFLGPDWLQLLGRL